MRKANTLFSLITYLIFTLNNLSTTTTTTTTPTTTRTTRRITRTPPQIYYQPPPPQIIMQPPMYYPCATTRSPTCQSTCYGHSSSCNECAGTCQVKIFSQNKLSVILKNI